jgi:hypothetical protein
VTTAIGAESMHADFAWPGVIANEPGSIVKAAIDLYTHADKWQQCQLNGIAIVNKLFNREENSQQFYHKFLTLMESLQQTRRNNFSGIMLRHHTMKSAMYMSQWIEAKNKLKDKK